MNPTATPTTETLETPHIVRTQGVCGGKPRIDGHRIKVEDVALWHEKHGMSPAEIVATYPTITLAEVHAALAYYYGHRDELEADIRAGGELAGEMKAEEPSLLAQKLEEHRAKNPLLGLMADEPGLMDEVLEWAMKDRESRPLRLPVDG